MQGPSTAAARETACRWSIAVDVDESRLGRRSECLIGSATTQERPAVVSPEELVGPSHFGTSLSRGQGNFHVGSLMAHEDILFCAHVEKTG